MFILPAVEFTPPPNNQMKYCEYHPFLNIFSWRHDNGEVYIPLSNESPDYYVINGQAYYSESELKRQGIKGKQLIILGEPDYLAPNRRYPGRGYIKLHLISKVNKLIPF